MQEFDDFPTQIQLVSNRLMGLGQLEMRPLKADSYHYLVQNTLYSAFNRTALRARTIEVYKDILNGEGTEPSVYDIMEVIDEENVEIIATFYSGFKWGEEDIDNVIAHYKHNIGCMLDEWITEILQGEGLFLKGLSLSKVYDRHHDKVKTMTDSEGQNLINPEWL